MHNLDTRDIDILLWMVLYKKVLYKKWGWRGVGWMLFCIEFQTSAFKDYNIYIWGCTRQNKYVKKSFYCVVLFELTWNIG